MPSVELSFLGLFRSADLPPSFVLSLRQYAFNLALTFEFDEHPGSLLDLLYQQGQRLHSPSISPFAIRSIRFGYLSLDTIASLARLGRAGPERAILPSGEIEWREDGVETLLKLIGGNFWLEWEIRGQRWFDQPVEEEGYENDAPYHVAEREMQDRVLDHNSRVERLRVTTRTAAVVLLRAARPLLSAMPAPLCIDPPQPSTYAPLKLASPSLSADPPPFSSSLPPPATDPHHLTTAAPASTPTCTTIIASLPYELVDSILSHLSPGHLSSNQHRLIMNWAEDWSTLGSARADSRVDFLRKTNCWRWESEIERVNLGSGYE
jgi:hypothetical protein